jgi:hypothetical protein
MALGVAAFVVASMPSAVAETLNCSPATSVPVADGKTGWKIDDVWTGTAVIYDTLKVNQYIYFGYYNASRKLTVARLDTRTNVNCRIEINSTFGGWDSHNGIVLGVDSAGNIHVAGNMHSNPLVYGAMIGGDFSTMRLRPMTGLNETSVTYPSFINTPDGHLLFIYRDGVSGNGRWLVTRYDQGAWYALSSSPLFDETWNKQTTSAYPSNFQFSSDGTAHLAIVWRHTLDVATNYAISYVRTKDFAHWTNSLGETVSMPINPGNADLVEMTGEHQGLVNSARTAVAPGGQALIVYTRYGPDGNNVVILASPRNRGWSRQVIATANHRTIISGGGSLPSAPLFTAPIFSDRNIGRIEVTFPGQLRQRIYFDPETLLKVPAPSAETIWTIEANMRPAPSSTALVAPVGLADPRKMIRSVRLAPTETDKKSAGVTVYFTQDLYRDQKRECTLERPKACAPPPSALTYVPAN